MSQAAAPLSDEDRASMLEKISTLVFLTQAERQAVRAALEQGNMEPLKDLMRRGQKLFVLCGGGGVMAKMFVMLSGMGPKHGWESEAADTPVVEEPDWEESGAYGFGLDGKDDDQVRPPIVKAGKVDLSAEDLACVDELVKSTKQAEKGLEHLRRAQEAVKRGLPLPEYKEDDQDDNEEEEYKRVNALLKQAGIEKPYDTSTCARAAIARGHIPFTGEASELDRVVIEEHCHACGDDAAKIKITLRAFLEQSDNGGWSSSGGAKCAGCDEEYFVTDACEGRPSMDTEKYLNHCSQCPGLGKCIGDRSTHCSAEGCNRHYFTGFSGSHGCPCLYEKYRIDCAKAGNRAALAYLFFDAQEAVGALLKRASGEDDDDDDDADDDDDDDEEDAEAGDDEEGDDEDDDSEEEAEGVCGSGQAASTSEPAPNPAA